MTERLLLLPGGRIGAAPADFLKVMAGAARFLGSRARALISQARRGDRQALHNAERRWAADLSAYLSLDVDLAGLDHVDRDGVYVVAPLHEGFADALVLLSLPLDLAWVVRDELMEWPLLGRYLSASRQPVHYPDGDLASNRRLYAAAGEILAAGESLVVFPQGTILGIETSFRQGAFRLARAFGVPILPVVLTGSHRVWEYPYTPRIRFGQQISMRILPAVHADHVTPDALSRRMKTIALDGTLAAPRHFDPQRDGFWDGYDYEIDPAFPALRAEIQQHRASLTG